MFSSTLKRSLGAPAVTAGLLAAAVPATAAPPADVAIGGASDDVLTTTTGLWVWHEAARNGIFIDYGELEALQLEAAPRR